MIAVVSKGPEEQLVKKEALTSRRSGMWTIAAGLLLIQRPAIEDSIPISVVISTPVGAREYDDPSPPN